MPGTSALDDVKDANLSVASVCPLGAILAERAAETDYSSALISSFMYAWVCCPQ